MKTVRGIVVISLAFALVGCVPESEDSNSPAPSDTVTGEPTKSTSKTVAALEGAVPADGEVVSGEFLLGAIIDGAEQAEVRFFVDGREIAVVNEAPYQLAVDGCELSAGNHAYIVEVSDEQGNRDYVEQWFTIEACD